MNDKPFILKNRNDAEILALIDEIESRCSYCNNKVTYDLNLERHIVTARKGGIMHRRCLAEAQRYHLAELMMEPARLS